MLDMVPGLTFDVNKTLKSLQKSQLSFLCLEMRHRFGSGTRSCSKTQIFSAHRQPCKHMFCGNKSYLEEGWNL